MTVPLRFDEYLLQGSAATDRPVLLPAARTPRPLPALGLDPDEVSCITVPTGDGQGTGDGASGQTVAELLHRHHVLGLVVLHRGRTAFEWYGPGADPAHRNPCFSVTKSFTGTLSALAMHDGVLDRGAVIADLVPELAASGFGDATVGQVADMTVSVNYHEDYGDAARPIGGDGPFGFGDYLAALEPGGPSTLRQLLTRFGPGPHPHGEVFDYATPKTDVLGWVIETVRGRGYGELLDEAIWSHVGAGHPAHLGVGPDGTPMLGAGLAMTTRDLARAGLVFAEQRHVPAAVIGRMRTGDPGPFARGGHYGYLTDYAYTDQWWLPPANPDTGRRPLSAWGIHGQLLWVDPEAELVVACHCGGPAASDPRRDLDQDALCRALTLASGGWAIA